MADAKAQIEQVRFNQMVKSILGHPLAADRSVAATSTMELWYRINFSAHTLFVPPVGVLQASPLEIEKFVEALNAFEDVDFDNVSTIYNWDDIRREPPELNKHYLEMLRDYVGPVMDVACDIETRRIEYNDNKLLAIGFAFETVEREFAIALAIHDVEMYYDLVQGVFNNECLNFIWQNGKFDTTRLMYLSGLDARVDDDTLLQHFTGINEKRGTHGLKLLGQVYLQAPAWEDELNAFKKKWCLEHKVRLADFTYDMIPIEILIPYLCKDIIATLRLCKLFRTMVRPDSLFIYRKLIKASNVYRDIELNGAELNKPHLKELKVQLEQQVEAADKAIAEIVAKHWDPIQYGNDTGAHLPRKGELEFNIGSSKQLKWLLTSLLGIEIKSTAKETLDELAEHADEYRNEDGRIFIKAIRDTRQASKYYDTYACGLESLVCDDGRIRCTYNLYGTETGRLSSSDPNMQNIPRNSLIKDLITCRPGYKLVQLDYSQAELRVLTALSGDDYLLHIYTTGQDLHDMMATKMFGPSFTKEQRVITKSLNFGIAYGRGPQSISQMFKLSMAEAKQTVEDWYAAVPKVKKFIEEKRKEPFSGKDCVTPFGRQRHFVITAENKYHVSNEAINFPIQSIASDLTLFSVLELSDYIRESKLDAEIIATVHDSIILEVVDEVSVIAQVVEAGKSIMAQQPKNYQLGVVEVPFRADAEVGYTWGNVEKWVS